MNPILRNIVAVVCGLVIGSLVNMAFILISGSVIAPPAGADFTTTEGLQASMHLMEPKHFLFPFLAHALGTLVGAMVAVKIAVSHHLQFALSIGALFLLGGIANIAMLPSPLWFSIVDLVLAYIPMSYLGYRIASKGRQVTSA